MYADEIWANLNKNSEKVINTQVSDLDAPEVANIAKFAYINGNWSSEQLQIRIKTELAIREIAKKANFQYTDYMVKLADCESMLGLKMTNISGNKPSTSIDRGYFMFNSHWQKGVSDACAYDINCSTQKVMEMINRGSQSLWICDKIIKGKTNFR
jgi:hypothetical protein